MTNLEISKKLKEIGFKSNFTACWAKLSGEFELRSSDSIMYVNSQDWYPAYDLETLINYINKFYYFKITNEYGTSNLAIQVFEDENNKIIREHVFNNESLTDTAGRLIIKLHDKLY